jgi:hypothetical protein
MSGQCLNPIPSCTKPSGARLSGDDTQQTDSASGLLGWQSGLIALACILAVTVVVAAVVFAIKRF